MNATIRSSRPVTIWLLVGVGMIVVQVILGGITRLTGSGLSITEWNLVTGTLPPSDQASWMAEFEKYRQTPQYQLLNSDFTLADFRFIYFWEWLHRLWARLIGVVFLVPFLVFLFQRRFRSDMVRPLLILFLLGALQGAVGWIMVASGLEGDAIYVKPTRLALHFIFALALLAYTWWFVLKLIIPGGQLIQSSRTRNLALVILGVLVLQLAYGALMAGHRAALAAPTWPDINGYFLPPHMLPEGGEVIALLENKLAVHFIHRGLAYLLFFLVLILTFRLYRHPASPWARRVRPWPVLLVVLQAIVGILTVLASPRIIPNQWGIFEWLALSHQLIAMLFFLSLVSVLFFYRPRLSFS